MEENKNEVSVQAPPIVASENPPTPPNKPKFSKKVKILIVACILLGILALITPFILANTLNSIYSRLLESEEAGCEECSNSNDADCAKKCNSTSAVINEAKITPTPTASPSSTLTPTIVKKVTFVPKASPTPAGNPTLVIKVGDGASTITLVNQTTGKTISEGITPPGKNYYVDPGAYRITVNEKPNYRAAYSICYNNCSLTGGSWDNDDWGTTVNVNVESGRTTGASFFYYDPNNLPWKCTGGSSKPYCL